MRVRRCAHGLAAAAVSLTLAAWPSNARADDALSAEDQPAVLLSINGGAYSPLTHLDEAADVDFQTSYSLGAGGAYRLNRYVALRGNFAFVRAEARDRNTRALTAIAGDRFNRYLYDADVQLRYPLQGGATPYAFVGGGAVTVERDLSGANTRFTKGAGKVGVGLSYQLPRSDFGVYVEGTGWLYKWDRYGFDKTQFDTTVVGGFSYRFKL